jgi:putative endonuclease
MFYTYILYSSTLGKFYTGQTHDPDHRIEEHNRGKTPFMANGMPWKLILIKEFDNRTSAINLEKYIKKRGAARFLQDNNIPFGWRITQGVRVVTPRRDHPDKYSMWVCDNADPFICKYLYTNCTQLY